MTTIDPTSSIGKLRLRLGDYSDLPIFEDVVYQSVLDDNAGSVTASTLTMANYILAALTSKTHQKMYQVEYWDNEQFQNYLAFLKLTILNPTFSGIAPIPYGGGTDRDNPIKEFVKNWQDNYVQLDQDQVLEIGAVPRINLAATEDV